VRSFGRKERWSAPLLAIVGETAAFFESNAFNSAVNTATDAVSRAVSDVASWFGL
jgi:hypothetical protein